MWCLYESIYVKVYILLFLVLTLTVFLVTISAHHLPLKKLTQLKL